MCRRIKGAASAISIIQHSLREATHNRARDNGDSLAFLTQENKAGKMQSTINQLKHRKRHALHDNGSRGVVSIDHYWAYSTSFRALTNTHTCICTCTYVHVYARAGHCETPELMYMVS